MVDLEKIDWEGIIISAIENPKSFDFCGFKELKEKSIEEEKHFKEKTVFENSNYKLIFKIGWDKRKFFFLYEHKIINKNSGEVIARVDESHGLHRPHRHIHSGEFVIFNPEALVEKLEHPIISLIINSESEERKKEWIFQLANELKFSQKNWRYLKLGK
ncbi:MAG: hypothetical protein WDZ77_01495 [Candidatus Pacearchaeota archaeon]